VLNFHLKDQTLVGYRAVRILCVMRAVKIKAKTQTEAETDSDTDMRVWVGVWPTTFGVTCSCLASNKATTIKPTTETKLQLQLPRIINI